MPKLHDLSNFDGITIKRPDAHDQLRGAVQSAVAATTELVSRSVSGARPGPMRTAVFAAIQTVNALMSAVEAKCKLKPPPEDIEMVPDQNGNLIYRCFHDPAHEWDLTGRRLP